MLAAGRAGEFPQVAQDDRLRAGPDQEKHRFGHESCCRVTGDEACSLAGGEARLTGS